MKANLLEWLGTTGVVEIQPVILTIGGIAYTGASYLGDSGRTFYFIGEPPYKKNHCFTCQGKVLAFAKHLNSFQYNALNDTEKKYFPFGPHFILFFWDEGFLGLIDEVTPHTKIPVILEGITLT